MIIAQEKKKTNLAEYILYMWQVEDLIRAYKFDINAIDKNLITQYNQDSEKHLEIRNWYDNLIEMMNLEKIQERGHLQIIKNNMNELNDFHLYLLNKSKDIEYLKLHETANLNILEFRSKAKLSSTHSEIEVCFTALYGILMLKLQKKEITKDTLAAINTFTQMLALLTDRYKKFEEDKD